MSRTSVGGPRPIVTKLPDFNIHNYSNFSPSAPPKAEYGPHPGPLDVQVLKKVLVEGYLNRGQHARVQLKLDDNSVWSVIRASPKSPQFHAYPLGKTNRLQLADAIEKRVLKSPTCQYMDPIEYNLYKTFVDQLRK